MWDQRYAEDGFAYGTSPNEFLVQSEQFIPPGGRVLCLAEGEGRNAVFLAEKGFEAVAVDSSTVGLNKATLLASQRGVSISTIAADLSDYKIPEESFDGIVSIFCHLPPALQAALHGQVYQGLRNGGVFILEGYSKKQITRNTGGPRNPDLLMDLEVVKQELFPLHLSHTLALDRSINEGSYHVGKGSVIQILGIKR